MTQAFRRLPPDRRLRAVSVGAGGMGRGWLRALSRSDDVDLVGVVDVNPDAIPAALADVFGADPAADDIATGTELTAVARAVEADLVVDVTIPEAHHAVTLEAFSLGLPVIGEKPMAATLAEAVSLTTAAEKAGELFMVSQSRRYDSNLFALKAMTGRLGEVDIVTTEFFKAPHFGGFRDKMAHPLVLDMAIHSFDSARFLLDAEPIAVYCEEYNPSWSWYAGDAGSTAIFEMSGGQRYVYTGSWCSPGAETSWNGRWRVSGRAGSATWDGDDVPAADTPAAEPSGVPAQVAATPPGQGIAGSLAEFVHALRTGTTPMGECHDNLLSLAMVHAAIASSRTRTRVDVRDILGDARELALTSAG
jgi:predicted dehydrogenase